MRTLWVGSIPGVSDDQHQVRLLGVGDGQIRSWDFAGSTPAEQMRNMQRLGTIMRDNGRNGLNANIFDILDVDKENFTGTAIDFVNQLFSSQRLFFNTTQLDLAIGADGTLLEVLADAGRALLEALGAA